MRKIANMIYDTIIVLSFCVLLWLIISWGDVILNNAPYQGREPHHWNAFVILTEVVAP